MKVTREEAIKILVKVTDKDDPYWEYLTDELYDERTDTMPTLSNILMAVGISSSEIEKAEKL